ncbi:hypothetical protein RFI_14525 [Reticulomyxa filosa]|uniref:Uncharacterized protein n=1 Tax=Reticulomyxa filosa TaxID=46433 RepID=X6N8P8_RETFI|nr:hypothetical protein RFI_14525 [Reticulomyxa filosa]|eukprot:ETO22670.1 hypothetical protein RFI_14525 [Reticulomyxa filosa]
MLDPTMGYCQGMNFIAAFILKQSQVYKKGIRQAIHDHIDNDKQTLNSTSKSANNKQMPTLEHQDHSQNTNNVNKDDASPKLDISCIDELEEQSFWLFAFVLSKIRSLFIEGVPGFVFYFFFTYN